MMQNKLRKNEIVTYFSIFCVIILLFGLSEASAQVFPDSSSIQKVPPLAIPESYDVFNLGTLNPGGTSYTIPFDLNIKGQAVGKSKCGLATCSTPYEHGFRGDKDSPIPYDLGVPSLGSSAVSYALGINDHGAIVGTTVNLTGDAQYAVFWPNGVAGQYIDLGKLGTYQGSSAKAINNKNQIVGTSILSFDSHAFLWENGVMKSLGTLAPGGASYAEDINIHGEVVGYASPTATSVLHHAVKWDKDGNLEDLGLLAPAPFSKAFAINDSGEVVGQAVNSAVLWKNGQMFFVELPLGSDPTGIAYDINNYGHIVGETSKTNLMTGDVIPIPFININGQAFNINDKANFTFPVKSLSPISVNNRGEILAIGEVFQPGSTTLTMQCSLLLTPNY